MMLNDALELVISFGIPRLVTLALLDWLVADLLYWLAYRIMNKQVHTAHTASAAFATALLSTMLLTPPLTLEAVLAEKTIPVYVSPIDSNAVENARKGNPMQSEEVQLIHLTNQQQSRTWLDAGDERTLALATQLLEKHKGSRGWLNRKNGLRWDWGDKKDEALRECCAHLCSENLRAHYDKSPLQDFPPERAALWAALLHLIGSSICMLLAYADITNPAPAFKPKAKTLAMLREVTTNKN